jgi:hypothetical protein
MATDGTPLVLSLAQTRGSRWRGAQQGGALAERMPKVEYRIVEAESRNRIEG